MSSTRVTQFLLGAAAIFFLATPLHAAIITIDFETLTEGISVDAAFDPDVTFSNAVVLTAGSSLNEIDFPPHSGTNVVFDSGSPIRLDFADPVSSFSAFFTYATAVTLQFYDFSSTLLGAVSSVADNNTTSGTGLTNELLAGAFAGTSFVTITGAASGSSFVLDDVVFETIENQAVPEPASAPLLVAGILFLILIQCRKDAVCAASHTLTS
jgi:hypothetical protein